MTIQKSKIHQEIIGVREEVSLSNKGKKNIKFTDTTLQDN